MSYSNAEIYEAKLVAQSHKEGLPLLAPDGGYVIRGNLFLAKVMRYALAASGVLFFGMVLVWLMAFVTGQIPFMSISAAIGLSALFLNQMINFVYVQTGLRVTYRFGVLVPALRERGLILDEVPADESVSQDSELSDV